MWLLFCEKRRYLECYDIFCFLGARKTSWGGTVCNEGKGQWTNALSRRHLWALSHFYKNFLSLQSEFRFCGNEGAHELQGDSPWCCLPVNTLMDNLLCSNNAPASLLTWNIFPLFQVDLVEIHALPNCIEPPTLKVQKEWYSLPLSKLIKYHSPSPPAPCP